MTVIQLISSLHCTLHHFFYVELNYQKCSPGARNRSAVSHLIFLFFCLLLKTLGWSPLNRSMSVHGGFNPTPPQSRTQAASSCSSLVASPKTSGISGGKSKRESHAPQVEILLFSINSKDLIQNIGSNLLLPLGTAHRDSPILPQAFCYNSILPWWY